MFCDKIYIAFVIKLQIYSKVFNNQSLMMDVANAVAKVVNCDHYSSLFNRSDLENPKLSLCGGNFRLSYMIKLLLRFDGLISGKYLNFRQGPASCK